jgi:HAD superfamily hydrolase (TIGR01509 family)
MKNIVFDLGRVVFAQNPNKSSEEFKRFFSYVAQSPMPQFWVDYDMGVSDLDKVVSDLSAYRGVEEEYSRSMILASITRQETIAPTRDLIHDLKQAGYKLYVLSNMSRDFIEYLRQQPVYDYFDGEVISCEEGVVKPMPQIYDILVERYGLDVGETMFIDDRIENVRVAEQRGITPFHFNRDDAHGSCELLREMLLG